MLDGQLRNELKTPKGWNNITTPEEVAFKSLTCEQQALVREASEEQGWSIDEAMKQLKDTNEI